MAFSLFYTVLIAVIFPFNTFAAYGTAPTIGTTLTAGHKALLAEVADQAGYKASPDNGRADPEMLKSFDLMKKAASSAGVSLKIESDYRGYQKQIETFFRQDNVAPDTIAEAHGETSKYDPLQARGRRIHNFYSETLTAPERIEVKKQYLIRSENSAPPGYSEHSTGYAVDINQTDITFESTEAFKWLEINASKYGFTMSYKKGSTQGAGYEPWHWLFTPGTATVSNNSGDPVLSKKYEDLKIGEHLPQYKTIIEKIIDEEKALPLRADFIVAVMGQETRFKSDGPENSSGARGIMQMIQSTAQTYGLKITDATSNDPAKDERLEPEKMIRAGTKYLSDIYNRSKDKTLIPKNILINTLAAYNAGEGVLEQSVDCAKTNYTKWFCGLNANGLRESQNYVGGIVYNLCEIEKIDFYKNDPGFCDYAKEEDPSYISSTNSSSNSSNSSGASLDQSAVQLGGKIPIGEFGSQIENSSASYFFVYLIKVFRWVAGIVGVFGVLMVVVGGLQIAVSRGNTGLVDAGTKRISGAVVGIVLLFTSSIILITINPQFYKTEGDIAINQIMETEENFQTSNEFINMPSTPGNGVSYVDPNPGGCTSESDIVTVTVPIKNYNNNDDTMDVKVSKQVAQEVKEIFEEIHQKGARIDKTHLHYFKCRNAAYSGHISSHGRGIALDLNFNLNVYLKLDPEKYPGYRFVAKNGDSTSDSISKFKSPDGQFFNLNNGNWRSYVIPAGKTGGIIGEDYDFTGQNTGTIHPDNQEGAIIINAFKARGWGWGGDWQGMKDYMHFSKDGH